MSQHNCARNCACVSVRVCVRVVAHMCMSLGMRATYIYWRLGVRAECEPNREIVSFRSCVRCEAVCARETMRFLLSLGFATVNSGLRARAPRALCIVP